MNRGFAALLTSIILSFVLLGTVLMTNRSAFYYAESQLLDEYKTQSIFIAHSCIEAAIVRILQDAAYVPVLSGDSFPILGGQCAIMSVEGNSTKLITVQAIFNDSYTNLQAVVDFDHLEEGAYDLREF